MIRPSPATSEEEALYPSPAETHFEAQRLAGDLTEPNGHPSVLLEVLAAPFRGVESAVRSAYNGIDLLTADALPDYHGDKKTNFLGNSETMPGKVIENISEFLTAFIPVVGIAGRGAKAIGLAGKAATFAAASGAGAFADFVAFEGHEERLSNLIQKYPALQNPVSEFLAAKEGDGEAMGRFKNALEGLALGALTEPLSHALTAMARVRGAKAGVNSIDEARAAVTSAEGRINFKKPAEAKAPGAVGDGASGAPTFTANLKDSPELTAVAKRLASISDSEISAGGLFQDPAEDINRFINAPKDVVDVVTEVARSQMDAEAKAGLVSGQNMLERAQTVSGLLGDLQGLSGAQIQDTALTGSKSLTEAVYLMEATRKFMLVQAKRVTELAGFVSKGEAAPGLRTVEQTALEAVRAQQTLATLVLTSRQSGTQLGRALNAIKYTKYAEVESLDLARQALEGLGGSEYVNTALAKLALAGKSGNPQDAAKGVLDLTRQQLTAGDRIMRVHNEFWFNAILSGTKTAVINTLGNTMTTVWQPLEAALGGVLNRDAAAVAGSLKSYVYMREALADSWSFFVKALKENENFLLPTSKVQDVGSRNAIDASKLFKDGTASQGFRAEAAGLVSGDGNGLFHFVNFVGETVRMPGRFLVATDEFYKQLNYRAAAKSELYYRGRTKGLQGEQLTRYIEENFSKTITQGGAAFSESAVVREAVKQAEAQGLQGKAYSDFLRDYVAKNYDANRSALAENFDVVSAAKDVSDEATFTRELGQFGQGGQRFVGSHPMAQLLIPFVRTPTNIVKYFAQRGLGATTLMPGIGKLQARNLADLTSTNALVRARAMGRISAGSAMVSVAGLAAVEGKITGAGPRDEHEKKLLRETGWQPYSFVFNSAEGPVYISYQRMDPLATFFGLVADWSEQAKRQDPMQSDVLEATLVSMATAVANNITNKTYLASLAQVIDAVSQPERRVETFARSRVASYVPAILAQWNSSLDHGQEMKEVRGFFDAAANRIPGAQGMLEPKRNVLGEPVDSVLASTPLSWMNPFTVSHRKGDPVFEELALLNHGLQPPSPVIQGDVNLLNYKTASGQTAYDAWLEKMGEVEVQGRTLRETLGRLIKTPAYQKLPLTAPDSGLDSPRLAEVKRVLRAYRTAALYQVQKEIPAVREAVGFSMEAKASLRRGDRARALESVQAIIAAAQ